MDSLPAESHQSLPSNYGSDINLLNDSPSRPDAQDLEENKEEFKLKIYEMADDKGNIKSFNDRAEEPCGIGLEITLNILKEYLDNLTGSSPDCTKLYKCYESAKWLQQFDPSAVKEVSRKIIEYVEKKFGEAKISSRVSIHLCTAYQISCDMDTIPELKESRAKIEDFIDQSNDDQVKNYKNNILRYDNNSESDLLISTEKLMNWFKDLHDLKEASSVGFIQNLIKRWELRFENDADKFPKEEFSKEGAKLKIYEKARAFVQKFMITQSLSKLEKILRRDLAVFKELKNGYKEQFNKSTNRLREIGEEEINNHEYFHLFGTIQMLEELRTGKEQEGSVQAKMLVKVLNEKINELVKNALIMVEHLKESISPQDVNAVVEKLKEIQKAKICVPRYLYDAGKIDVDMSEIKQKLNHSILNHVKEVEKLFSSPEFPEASWEIAISAVYDILKIYCGCDLEVYRAIKMLDEVYKNASVKTRKSWTKSLKDFNINFSRVCLVFMVLFIFCAVCLFMLLRL